MKQIKFLVLITISVLLGSCSSDSSSSSSSENQYFNFKYDGQNINVNTWQAQKGEDRIAVSGYGSNGISISFEFNVNGDIGEVDTYSVTDFSFQDSQAQAYYTNESFNFELVSLNENNKTVKVNYSGKVYEDAYDLTSASVNIEGSFLVEYTEITPQIPGLVLSAKINGENFYESKTDQTGGFFSGSDITLAFYNGDQYSMNLTINHDNTVVGNYPFTPATATNKVTLSRYNTALDLFEEFDATGNVTITEKTVGSQLTVVSGTFTFTAVDPVNSSQISVTNGTFKTAYSNY